MTFEGLDFTSTGMKTTVTDKWQVTIPKPLRKQLGLRPGQVLDVKAERGHLVATKAAKADSVERVYGILRLGHSTNQILTTLRGKVDAV